MDTQEQIKTQKEVENTHQNENKKLTISTPNAIILAGFLIAIALIFSGKSSSKESVTNQKPTVTEPTSSVTIKNTDYVRGDLNKAEVVIVEYSDSDCPFCQRFHSTMLDVMKKYGDKVAWIYRYFPLSIHPDAENEAIALECSAQLGGNDIFWKYLDQVINITVTPDQSASVLTSTAVNLGLDKNLFTSCLTNPATVKKVNDQSNEAQALGAKGTPYSIAINKSGQQVAIPGAYPIEEVTKIIDELIK